MFLYMYMYSLVSRLVGEEMAKLRKTQTATQPQLRKVGTMAMATTGVV